jgi:hypothetical protein
MLIRKRGPLAAILDEPNEIEEDDIFNEPNGDEEIAA